jgi:C4-dicarboxylate-specific signal transduction histidine kinase
VFVNLIDNAIFWLKDRPEPRIIRLDAHEDAMLVVDNGPGVPARDREAIFELGFTRKPGGRGLGLHISREVLDRVGYSLELDPAGPQSGATFRLVPKAESPAKPRSARAK